MKKLPLLLAITLLSAPVLPGLAHAQAPGFSGAARLLSASHRAGTTGTALVASLRADRALLESAEVTQLLQGWKSGDPQTRAMVRQYFGALDAELLNELAGVRAVEIDEQNVFRGLAQLRRVLPNDLAGDPATLWEAALAEHGDEIADSSAILHAVRAWQLGAPSAHLRVQGTYPGLQPVMVWLAGSPSEFEPQMELAIRGGAQLLRKVVFLDGSPTARAKQLQADPQLDTLAVQHLLEGWRAGNTAIQAMVSRTYAPAYPDMATVLDALVAPSTKVALPVASAVPANSGSAADRLCSDAPSETKLWQELFRSIREGMDGTRFRRTQ